MTLVQLRHLLSIADTGSFTRSASQLHITQPALSRSIKALELELGELLFDRIGKHTELTPFGAVALQRARMLVAEADELVASGRERQAGRAGRVRVGMGSGPGAVLAGPLLKTMASRYPAVRIEIARGQTDRLVGALRERQLDALVVDARSLPVSADLHVTDLVEMRGTFLCRSVHPLTRARGPIRFDAICRFPIASTPLSDEIARALVERYGPRAHPDECVSLRNDDLRTLVGVALETDAVLIAIRAAAPELVELPMKPAFNVPARFGVVTLAGRSEVPAMRLVRELVRRFLHD